jgi:hypothetical protein
MPAAMLKILAAPNIIPAFDGHKGLRTEAARRFIYQCVRRHRLTNRPEAFGNLLCIHASAFPLTF